MEIAPVPVELAHFQQTADGRMVEVHDDVTNVARDLAAIDPTLRLRYSEAGGYFVVYQERDGPNGLDRHLVLTAEECDQRIVRRVEKIRHPSYNLADELERGAREGRERKREEARAVVRSEGDRLMHALRRQLRVPRTRIFVP